MDIITAIVFIILFLIVMLFAFSMGTLSPYVGKKEITSIIIIGFILGALGGFFFLYPIYEETPYVAATIHELFSNDDETINVILPSSSNVSKFSSDILNQDGVNSISTNGFDLKTYAYTNSQQEYIKNHLNGVSEIEAYNLNNSIISVNLTKNAQSTSTLGSLVTWLSKNNINSEFAFIHLQIKLKPSSINSVKDYLNENHYTISSIEGPVQNVIKNLSEGLVDKWIFVVITGFIGILVSVLGIYINEVVLFIRKRRK